MDKFFERLTQLIDNSATWLWSLFVLVILKDQIKKIFEKIGIWLRKGFNADVVAKILQPIENKLDKFNLRLVKVEAKFELFEEKQDKILRHLQNNNRHIENLLESIKKDEEYISQKIDEKSQEFSRLLNKGKGIDEKI